MSSPSPSPGDRIGRYTLERRLGTGGMGEVWQATLHGPQGFRKPVALKLLRAGPAQTAHREALLHEARIGALLHHPNVVSVHTLEEHDHRWIVAMELVRGASVGELLTSGPLPPTAVVEVGVQACAGLAHIHGLLVDGQPARLVHRDIKPANLLVDQSGRVRIADLGVAAAAGGSTEALGTPGYLAPEQLKGRADARSDLFSLGVTLVRCATAKRPFGNGIGALAAVRRADHRLADGRLFAEVDDAVAGLGEVVRRCLRGDPAARWSSATELGAALSALRGRQPPGTGLAELVARARPDLPVASQASVSAPSRETDAPTLVLTRGNVPATRDRFFGRQEALEDLLAKVRSGDRLITLLGPGGAGKTRLSLMAGAELRDGLAGSAWFFDLAEARTVDGICFAMTRGLGLVLERTDPVGQIGAALRAHGRSVVILDNLEQCIEHVPATVARWVDAAPGVSFVCTSRVPLGLRGEQQLRLGPLSTTDGIALFVDRSPIAITADQLDAVGAVVELLEGMPLAIELAAARAGLVPVSKQHRRLSEGLRMLSGGGQELPERHRSVEASLRWSWELLSPAQRTALAELSVFEGGLGFEAAEAVLSPTGPWALDVLQELVDASLVRVNPDTSRFSMLVGVQAFAAARLTGEARRVAEQRHGAWFAQLDDALIDQDNLVIASRRAIERGDGQVAAGCALGAWSVFQLQGPFEAGLALLEGALEVCDDRPTQARLRTLAGRGQLLCGRSDAALAHFEVAREAYRQLADARGEGRVLGALGNLQRRRGRNDEAAALYQESLQLLEGAGDPHALGTVTGAIGNLHMHSGRMDEAERYLNAALELHRQAGHGNAQGIMLGNLGVLMFEQGRNDEGQALFERALTAHREAGDRRSESLMLGNLGALHFEAGDHEAARNHLDASIAVSRAIGARRSEGIYLGNLGVLHQVQGRLDEARRCLDTALDLVREVQDRRFEGEFLRNLGVLDLEQGRMDTARVRLDAAQKVLVEVGDRRSEAMVLAGLAQLELRQGDLPAASERAVRAEALLREVRNPSDLMVVLCTRAEIALAMGDRTAAGALLQEAEATRPARSHRAHADIAKVRRKLAEP